MNLSLKQAELTIQALGWTTRSYRDESNMKVIEASKGRSRFTIYSAGGIMGQFTVIDSSNGARHHIKPSDFALFFRNK